MSNDTKDLIFKINLKVVKWVTKMLVEQPHICDTKQIAHAYFAGSLEALLRLEKITKEEANEAMARFLKQYD